MTNQTTHGLQSHCQVKIVGVFSRNSVMVMCRMVGPPNTWWRYMFQSSSEFNLSPQSYPLSNYNEFGLILQQNYSAFEICITILCYTLFN